MISNVTTWTCSCDGQSRSWQEVLFNRKSHLLASSHNTHVLTIEVGSKIYAQGGTIRLILDTTLGSLMQGILSTLDAPIDRTDRGTKLHVVHHGIVTRWRRSSYPEPDSRLEGDDGIERDVPRVVDSIEVDRISGIRVVVVLRELDGVVSL